MMASSSSKRIRLSSYTNDGSENNGSFMDFSNDRYDNDLPDIQQRLQAQTPSKEVVDYYRNKIWQLENDYDELTRRIDEYRLEHEVEYKLRRLLAEREEDLGKLQAAISQLQVQIFKEKEYVLRLTAENDRLNLKQLEDKKIIQTLLEMIPNAEKELTLFVEGEQLKSLLKSKSRGTATSSTGGVGPNVADKFLIIQNDILKNQVSNMRQHLEQKIILSKTEIDALLEDRRIRFEETEADRKRDSKRIAELTNKLENSEMKLRSTMTQLIDTKKHNSLGRPLSIRNQRYRQHGVQSKKSYEHLEKRTQTDDNYNLARSSDFFRNKENVERSAPKFVKHSAPITRSRKTAYSSQQGTNSTVEHLEIIQNLKQKLNNAQHQVDRCKSLHKNFEFTRSSGKQHLQKDVDSDAAEKDKELRVCKEKLNFMTKQLKSLESRRNFELEGFKSDIKLLKDQVQELEKLLFKVAMNIENETKDMAVLQVVRQTAGRSKKINDDLHKLKTKVFDLESQFQYL